jgi:glycosyltransferase involved in cell wall biosynthesis
VRILHVPQAYAPVLGGGEVHCRKVSEVLARRGHEVRVVTGNVRSPADYTSGRAARPAGPAQETLGGVEVRRVPFGGLLMTWIPHLRWLPIPGRGMLRRRIRRDLRARFAAGIDREIRRYRPDVVMTMAHLQLNVECVVEAHRRGPRFPLVVVPLIHDGDERHPVEAMRRVLAEADAVVANTEFERGLLASRYGVPEERAFVGSLGVDLPPEPPETPREPVVLYLGRKVLDKGIGLLVEAMRVAWARRPDARLVLAGARHPGSDGVDGLLASAPAAERARIASPYDVSEAEKARLLDRATCLVLPSAYESFGLVLLEAFAHALPVVTFDLPVFRSTVTEGVDGLLTPVGDAGALGSAILSLLDDASRARRLGAAARRTAEARFAWDAVGPRYEAAYRHAVDHPR